MGAVRSQVRRAVDAADTTSAAATSGALAAVLTAFGIVQWVSFPPRETLFLVGPAFELVGVLASVAGPFVFDFVRSDRRLYRALLAGCTLFGVSMTTAMLFDLVAQPFAFRFVFQGATLGLAGVSFLYALGRWIERVEERKAELERQNERLDEFAAVASHDLRSPLQVAHGSLLAVREDGDEAALDRLERSITRMDTIVDDVLQFSRIANESIERESVQLSAVATEAWESVQADEAALRIESDGRVPADPRLLQQALENLFRNAMDHGGDDVTIWIGATTDGFYVMDDGPGIDSDQRDQVFDSGYSGGASTGLGLAIVSRIVEAHGWSIRTVTGHDGGARFEVRTE